MKHIYLASIVSAGGIISCPAALVGLWEFNDSGDLGKATFGTDLTVQGTSPSHSASMSDSGSKSLSGVITTVVGSANYLDVTHNIGANGGGTFTNQYTLVYDIKRPTGNLWRSFYQTGLGNGNDAEFFTRGGGGVVNSLGRATAGPGYTSTAMPEETWQRIVISVDLTGSFNVYADGTLMPGLSVPSSGVDGGYSLDTSRVLIFADNSASENNPFDVGALAIYDGAMTAGEVSALGVAGDVIAIPEPSSTALLSLGGLALILRRRRG